jgi:hypothetical protein
MSGKTIKTTFQEVTQYIAADQNLKDWNGSRVFTCNNPSIYDPPVMNILWRNEMMTV